MTIGCLSLVFTGHMVDLPGRKIPRFPPEIVEAVKGELARRISYQVGARDKKDVKGFASLARGGDILFHEVCRETGIETVVVLPFAPSKFLATSVEGTTIGNWPQRFRRIWDTTAPDARYVLGLPQSDSAYADCNNRLLDLARAYGAVQLIAVWNGADGEGVGGTGHFVDRVKQESGREPDVIDPKQFIEQN
jgi:hypothetical protein